MADTRRLVGYGLILNVLFLLTVYDLMAKGKSDHEEEDRVDEPVDKTLPEPKILNMRSGPAGPVLKFLYWKVFEQYRQALSERFPDISIEGANFDPDVSRLYLAKFLSYAKIAIVFAIACNINPFLSLGMETPGFVQWAQTNKVYACLMAWFVTGMFENSLMSTGAFEIFYNDMPVWSKLESGRVPEFPEVLSLIGQQSSSFYKTHTHS